MTVQLEARAVLKINRRNTNSVQGRTKAVAAGLGSGAQFASLASNVTALQSQSTTLDKAETVAGTKARGSAAARNVQRNLLVGMLQTILPLVQAIANQAGTLDAAIAVIEAAGLVVKLVAKRTKPILAATQSLPGGPVVLDANATALGAAGSKKSFFNWSCSSDGKTWLTLPPTPKARTSVANLTPLTTYGFRVAVTDSSGVTGAWSQALSFLVH